MTPTCLSGVTCESEWKDEITQSVVRNEIVNNNDDRMDDQIYRTVETVDENLDTEDVPSVFLEAEFAKLHMGLVVLVKKMSVLVNFLLKNTNLLSVLSKICQNSAGHV